MDSSHADRGQENNIRSQFGEWQKTKLKHESVRKFASPLLENENERL